MSHAATNWAIQQRGLKPATKLLLWCLSDRHNKDTKRCDPSQELLAYDAEMSRATVNRQLDVLEGKTLVRRVPRICPRTKKQLSTAYELAFDCDLSVLQNETQPASQIDTRAVSQKTQKQCLNSGDSRVSNCDTNFVKEPKTKSCGPGADPQTPDLQSGFLEEFAAAFPRIGNLEKTETALRQAIAGGAKPEGILAGAKSYAVEQAGNQSRYIAYSENWVAQARWVQFEQPAADPADAEKITERWVKAIKTGHQALARHCSIATARDLIDRMLVTEDECRDAGISL
jgi:hypothetical protein